MKQDVLAELHSGSMNLEQVEALYDRLLDGPKAGDAAELLGLSKAEWTALAQGVWFEELARWRYDGWPTTCADSGEPIDVTKFGWLAREQGDHHVLVKVG